MTSPLPPIHPRPYGRRDSLVAAAARRERDAGHADARVRAVLLVDIEDATADLSRVEAYALLNLTPGSLVDGSLPTQALHEAIAALRLRYLRTRDCSWLAALLGGPSNIGGA